MLPACACIVNLRDRVVCVRPMYSSALQCDIIKNNTKTIDPSQKLNIIFYYENPKCSNLVMINNLSAKPTTLEQINVVYSFACPSPHCKAYQYIGLTQTTLSRRLTMHAQAGSILQHYRTKHKKKPTRQELVDNTQVLARAENRYKLAIKEALLILKKNPSINKQFDNFTNILKLHAHRNPNSNNPTPVIRPNSNNRVIPPPSAPPLTSEQKSSDKTFNNMTTENRLQFPLAPVITQCDTITDPSVSLSPKVPPPALSQNNIMIPSAPPLSQYNTAVNPAISLSPQISSPHSSQENREAISLASSSLPNASNLHIDLPTTINTSTARTSSNVESPKTSQHILQMVQQARRAYEKEFNPAPVIQELVTGSYHPSFYRTDFQRSRHPNKQSTHAEDD